MRFRVGHPKNPGGYFGLSVLGLFGFFGVFAFFSKLLAFTLEVGESEFL